MLSQSAPGKHHARKSAHTGKEVSDDRRLLILKILDILDILLQTTENAGRHTSLPTTAGGALARHAYRGFTGARLQSAFTGESRPGGLSYRGFTVGVVLNCVYK